MPLTECEMIPSYSTDIVKDNLNTLKLLYTRIGQDFYQYLYELATLQSYFQNYNLNDTDTMKAVIRRMNNLAEALCVFVVNHLTTTTNVTGVGDKIIKPVTSTGKQSTIKYQNVTKTCHKHHMNIDGCLNGNMKIQFSKTIATYDNISITRIKSGANTIGYTFKIGTSVYTLRNGNSPSVANLFLNGVTQADIAALFAIVDEESAKISEINRLFATNVRFIERYIASFNASIAQ
jgi:hypothetical protein